VALDRCWLAAGGTPQRAPPRTAGSAALPFCSCLRRQPIWATLCRHRDIASQLPSRGLPEPSARNTGGPPCSIANVAWDIARSHWSVILPLSIAGAVVAGLAASCRPTDSPSFDPASILLAPIGAAVLLFAYGIAITRHPDGRSRPRRAAWSKPLAFTGWRVRAGPFLKANLVIPARRRSSVAKP
jgi:hypothetical protein